MPTLIEQLDELIAHRGRCEHTEVREEQGDVARRRVVARGLLRDQVVRRRAKAHEGGVLSLALALRQVVLRWERVRRRCGAGAERVRSGCGGGAEEVLGAAAGVRRGCGACAEGARACESGNMRANLVDSAAT